MRDTILRLTLAACVCTSSAAGQGVGSGNSGVVAGRVVFRGTPPRPTAVDMSKDAGCVTLAGSSVPDEAVLVDPQSGGIQNVFVRVTDGLDASRSFDVPTEPIELNQQGCRFRPRVLGVRVGQPLVIVNGDPLLHDIHATPMRNAEFNLGQPIQGMRTSHTFVQPEVMVPLGDDIHPWKTAFVGVVAHPFFAVTGPDGAFTIAGLPPGSYTIEAWHEVFGTTTGRVTIDPGQTRTMLLEYRR